MVKKELAIILFLLILPLINAQLGTSNKNRLEFGHVMIIKDLKTDPAQISPGSSSVLQGTILNNANSFVNDVVIKLVLPNEIGFFNDINVKKASTLSSGEQSRFAFNIIALPNTPEGVYKANLIVDYVNNVGEVREDNNTISIIVKGNPNLYALVEDSEIYSGNRLGNVNIKIINNDVANIKFLTVEIEDSKNYEIISANKNYVGDLDSNDFDSVAFKLKSNKNSGELTIPMKLMYKDAFNNDYTKSVEVIMPIRSASDVGKSTNTIWYIIGAIIVVAIIYYIYRKYKKRKKLNIKF